MKPTKHTNALLISLLLVSSGYACKADTVKCNSDSTSLEVTLSCDKTEFIQGESIDVLIKIKNNTNDTISISPKHYLYDYNSDSTFSNGGRGIIIIPPFENYYYMLDPSDWLLFLGRMDLTTFTLKPGNYEYYTSASLSNKKYLSNKINIKVNAVPDTLESAFNNLKYDKKNWTTIETAEKHLEKYKYNFYATKFYRRVFDYGYYYNAIQNKDEAKDYRERAIKLYKEYILRFPNTSIAYGSFPVIMFNYADNQSLVEEILKSLKQNQPDCKLLVVLRNQSWYKKQLIQLLN